MFRYDIDTEELIQLFDQNMAIAVFDCNGYLYQANSNYITMLQKISPLISIGQSYHEFIPNHFLGDNHVSLEDSFRQVKNFLGIFQQFTIKGELHYFEINMMPLKNENKEKIKYIQILSDVTGNIDIQKGRYLDRLKLAIDSIDTAMLITNKDGGVIYANGGFSRLFGWEYEEIYGKKAIEILKPHEETSDIVNFQLPRPVGEQKSIELDKICISKDKQFYWMKIFINFIFNHKKELQYRVLTFTDITRSKIHESLQYKALESMVQEKPLSATLDLICLEVERIVPDIAATILEVDRQGYLHPLASPSFPMTYSHRLDGLEIGPKVGSCGTAAWRKESVFVKDIATDPLWEQDSATRNQVLSLGYKGCWSTPFFNKAKEVIGTFAFYFRQVPDKNMISFYQYFVNACTYLCALAIEREKTRQHIRQLAFYDTLTKLPNRALLQATIDQVIETAIHEDEALAVLFIDLDRFKKVNDSLGHKAGDDLLNGVATRLRSALKSTEVVGRLSGDEFVVILPHCGTDQVTARVEHLQAILSEPMLIEKTSIAISASVGIAMFPMDGRDIDTLLSRADMAMYQAKKKGQGNFCFFSVEMNQKAQEKLILENALRQAVIENQLELYYQPQFDLNSNRLYGVEALARWNHSKLGHILPSVFIPIAEECGLVMTIGYWALEEACSQLSKWRAQGMNIPKMSVNLSAISFHDLSLPTIITNLLKRFNLKPQVLTLELTETILLDTNQNTVTTLAQIHQLGVRLSMDDFGTGYASLSCLHRLSVNELKLDRSFVACLETDEIARALSGAILDIGKNLNLDVVAEGIETEAQNKFLCNQGYNIVQGHLFAKAMNPQELEVWWKKRYSIELNSSF